MDGVLDLLTGLAVVLVLGWIVTQARSAARAAVESGRESQARLLLGTLGVLEGELGVMILLLGLILWRVW